MRRNGRPKGCFSRVRLFSALLRFALKTPENLKRAEKKRTLQKHPLGQPFLRTTPSPSPWHALMFEIFEELVFFSERENTHTHTNTHTHIYIYKQSVRGIVPGFLGGFCLCVFSIILNFFARQKTGISVFVS